MFISSTLFYWLRNQYIVLLIDFFLTHRRRSRMFISSTLFPQLNHWYIVLITEYFAHINVGTFLSSTLFICWVIIILFYWQNHFSIKIISSVESSTPSSDNRIFWTHHKLFKEVLCHLQIEISQLILHQVIVIIITDAKTLKGADILKGPGPIHREALITIIRDTVTSPGGIMNHRQLWEEVHFVIPELYLVLVLTRELFLLHLILFLILNVVESIIINLNHINPRNLDCSEQSGPLLTETMLVLVLGDSSPSFGHISKHIIKSKLLIGFYQGDIVSIKNTAMPF